MKQGNVRSSLIALAACGGVLACSGRDHTRLARGSVDAGVPVAAPSAPPPDAGGGSGGQGGGGGAGGSGRTPGDAGGEPALLVPGCRGCVSVRVPAAEYADVQLQLASLWNLSTTRISWRVRVINFTGDVSVVPYVQSGTDADDEATPQISTLSESEGWQERLLDIGGSRPDAGSPGPGVIVESGASFDATRVRRLGIAFQLAPETGPATVEIDEVTFSDVPALNADFASSQSGYVLVDSPGAMLTHVPE